MRRVSFFTSDEYLSFVGLVNGRQQSGLDYINLSNINLSNIYLSNINLSRSRIEVGSCEGGAPSAVVG